MKIAGIMLAAVGVFVLSIGLIAFVYNLTSDYAPSICARAVADRSKIDEAERICSGSSPSQRSDCRSRLTTGLTSEASCEYAKERRIRDVLISSVPVVVGFLMMFFGFVLWLLGRRAKRIP